MYHGLGGYSFVRRLDLRASGRFRLGLSGRLSIGLPRRKPGGAFEAAAKLAEAIGRGNITVLAVNLLELSGQFRRPAFVSRAEIQVE